MDLAPREVSNRLIKTKGGSNIATMEDPGLCAATDGAMKRLQWSADKWGYQRKVHTHGTYIMITVMLGEIQRFAAFLTLHEPISEPNSSSSVLQERCKPLYMYDYCNRFLHTKLHLAFVSSYKTLASFPGLHTSFVACSTT